MTFKPSKLDIGPITRKEKTRKLTHQIKREVFEYDLILNLRNKAKPVFDQKPRISTEKIREKIIEQNIFEPPFSFGKISFTQLAPFAAAALIAVFFVHGIVYVSSARNASGEILGE